MFRIFVGEEFRVVRFDEPRIKTYAISNLGRLISYTDSMEDAILLKGNVGKQGYRVISFRVRRGKKIANIRKQFSRMVAESFVEKTSEDQIYVLHLDHNKLNDHYTNLKWATREEVTAHSKKSPMVIEAKRKAFGSRQTVQGQKLTATKVMFIKKLLSEPKRKTRIKIIAKRFGVSEMTIHRIRTGENWAHIKI